MVRKIVDNPSSVGRTHSRASYRTIKIRHFEIGWTINIKFHANVTSNKLSKLWWAQSGH